MIFILIELKLASLCCAVLSLQSDNDEWRASKYVPEDDFSTDDLRTSTDLPLDLHKTEDSLKTKGETCS